MLLHTSSQPDILEVIADQSARAGREEVRPAGAASVQRPVGWDEDLDVYATVEEIRDMSVFFGFGDAELIFVGETDGFSETVGYFFRREGEANRETPFVFGHGDEKRFKIFPLETIEFGYDEGFGEFPSPVFAEIKENDCVIVLDGDERILF